MSRYSRAINILVAESNDRDFELMLEAWEKVGITNRVHRVRDGEELINCLNDPCKVENDDFLTDLVIADVHLPKLSGVEVLRQMKSNPQLKKIPVILLTTSDCQEEINLAYDLGVNSLLEKPDNFDEWIHVSQILKKYWIDLIKFPDKED